MEQLINEFSEEKQCDYKGEVYSVRDNGAVMRHLREKMRTRKDDGVWTFGKKDEKTGYMKIGQHRVHIIVATAFYGQKNSKIYVVDHIDTNRCNNRVENLRWLTRLENILMNPVSLKRVTMLCGGDITKFIKNPSCLRDLTGTNKDLMWMRNVSSEEASIAYKNVMSWGLKPIDNNQIREKSVLSDKSNWIFKDIPFHYNNCETAPQFIKAKSPITALQFKWKTPTEFKCCPIEIQNHGLDEYYENLHVGTVFSTNQHSTYWVMDRTFINNKSEILVVTYNITPNAIKPYGLVKIYKSGHQFIHESISTFFEENGVNKVYTEMQGLIWEGEHSIDEYLS